MPKKPFISDDEEQVSAAQKKADRRALERTEAIRRLMGRRDGRALINQWLEFLDMFGNPFVTGDPYATHINIGMANAGKMIWAAVEEAAPASCLLMRQEAKEDEKQDGSDPA